MFSHASVLEFNVSTFYLILVCLFTPHFCAHFVSVHFKVQFVCVVIALMFLKTKNSIHLVSQLI